MIEGREKLAPPSKRRRSVETVVALLLLALFTCFLFAPLVTSAFTSEVRFLEWDVPEQYWPDLVYLCTALHDGELPYWNPYDRAGYPYYADPQAGGYHPLNWAICAVAGPSPALFWAELRVVLGFFMAGAFGLLWLRRYQLPLGAALLGAVIIETAPFMRHNWELNLTAALAYFPLMLWAVEGSVESRRVSDGALLGFAVALCAWVGSPPALWLAGTYTIGFWLWRTIETIHSSDPHRRMSVFFAIVRVALVAAFICAGLTLVVIVPGALLAQHSVQAGRSFESIAEGGLELAHLRALVSPLPGNHLYFGLIALALAPLALLFKGGVATSRGNWTIPAKWFHLIMALVAVLMTLGAEGPLFRLAFDWVPGVSTFRLPHRYEAWLGPAVGFLAAVGLCWLSSSKVVALLRRQMRSLRSISGALLLLGTAITILVEEGWRAPGLFIFGLGGLGLAVSFRRDGASKLAAGALLSALLIFDVSQSLPLSRHTREGPLPGNAIAARPILDRAPDTHHSFRYLDEFGISCRSGARFGRRDFRGYQDPLLLRSYERILASLGEHPGLLAQFNVRYILTGPHFIHGWRRHYLSHPDDLLKTPGNRDLGRGVIELSSTLPAAYWVPLERVTRFEDRPAALRAIRRIAPAPVAFFDGAVIPIDSAEDDMVPVGTPESQGVSSSGIGVTDGAPEIVVARNFSLERDHLSFDINAPKAGIVVINEAWYPGWSARVDDREVSIYRVNALVRALSIEAGDHRVEMEFRPREGVVLRWIMVGTLILCALLLTMYIRRGVGNRGP